MREKRRLTATDGVEMRTAPRDGRVVKTVAQGTTFEILSEESWLRIRLDDGSVGFLPADFAEPVSGQEPAITEYQSTSTAFVGNPIRSAEGFHTALAKLEAAALSHKVQLHIVSSFREPNKLVPGAIVKPARLSNHMVGHAIDMNIVADGKTYGSVELARVTIKNGAIVAPDDLPAGVVNFLKDVLGDETLRWGGTFSPPDPVHIDDSFNVRDAEAFNREFIALWGAGALGGKV